MSTDELIARLPPAGQEWLQVRHLSDRAEEPASQEMEKRLAPNSMTDEQWRRALLSTGAIRFREQWPRAEEYAISLCVPRWVGIGVIEVHPKIDGLRGASAGELAPGISGTGAMMDARDARFGRKLGLLPAGTQELLFDVKVERGKSLLAGLSNKPEPAPGVLWRGEIKVPIRLVENWEAAVPPVADPALENAVRDAIGAGFRDWNIDGQTKRVGYVNIDPDCVKFRALETTALDLSVEVLRDGASQEVFNLVASDVDTLSLCASVSKARKRFYGSANLKSIAETITSDPDEARHWALRITGRAEHVKYLWSAKQRWEGTLTIPWTDAVKHESDRAAPTGRGPEMSTPYWK